MSRKKLKITIECEGSPTQVLEANGMAAALLKDGDSENSHGLSCLICGNMNRQDLIHLHDGVENELVSAVAQTVIRELSPLELMKIILGGKKHGSD